MEIIDDHYYPKKHFAVKCLVCILQYFANYTYFLQLPNIGEIFSENWFNLYLMQGIINASYGWVCEFVCKVSLGDCSYSGTSS